MKCKFWTLFVAAVLLTTMAGVASATPVRVPDAGSSIILLGIAVSGLGLIARRKS